MPEENDVMPLSPSNLGVPLAQSGGESSGQGEAATRPQVAVEVDPRRHGYQERSRGVEPQTERSQTADGVGPTGSPMSGMKLSELFDEPKEVTTVKRCAVMEESIGKCFQTDGYGSGSGGNCAGSYELVQGKKTVPRES